MGGVSRLPRDVVKRLRRQVGSCDEMGRGGLSPPAHLFVDSLWDWEERLVCDSREAWGLHTHLRWAPESRVPRDEARMV